MHSPKQPRIPVTKPALPDLDSYINYLSGIWERGQLTNNGPLVKELEIRIKDYLGVKHCLAVSSGTVALQLALKALELNGEVITTPFSFVATSSAIAWEGCQPVFADIENDTLCIDPDRIEAVLTENTQAILATHIHGHPCAVDAIEHLAVKHHLKVIYDAAHAFGVNYRGQSLLNFGDISTLSFHATKLFYTGEGGAVVCDDDCLAERIRRMRDFGINGPEAFFPEIGINAKMSELHAALGLCVLPGVSEAIARRKAICLRYDAALSGRLARPVVREGTEYNYAYYPVILASQAELQHVQDALNQVNVYPRRYFYPPLSRLDYVSQYSVPLADNISARILCLPLYEELDEMQIDMICNVVLGALDNYFKE